MMNTTNRRRHSTMPPVFALTLLNERGEQQTVLSIAAEMQATGTDQRLIDRWIQGLEVSLRQQARRELAVA